MKKIALLLSGLVWMSAHAAYAYDDGEWELWLSTCAGGKLTEHINVNLDVQSLWGDDVSEYYEQQALLSFDGKIASWLKVGVGMRQVFSRVNRTIYTARATGGETVYSEVTDRYWRGEQRPTVDLTFMRTFSGWKLDDRVRFEYRAKENSAEYMRYRNRIRVRAPWKWTPMAINPYVAWEANYSDKPDKPDWDRMRYYAGISTTLAEKLKGGLYYCLERNLQSDDSWKDVNVAGINVDVAF